MAYYIIIFPHTGLKALNSEKIGFATKSKRFINFQAKIAKFFYKNVPIAIAVADYRYQYPRDQIVEWIVPWVPETSTEITTDEWV